MPDHRVAAFLAQETGVVVIADESDQRFRMRVEFVVPKHGDNLFHRHALDDHIAQNVAKRHPKGTYFLVGERGLEEELNREGLRRTKGRKADVVVVGLDRWLTYNKLDKAGVTTVEYKEYAGIEHMLIVREALPDAFALFDKVAKVK